MDKAHQHRPVTPVGRAHAFWPRVLLAALGWLPAARAQLAASGPDEAAQTIAFLYNRGSYTEWPAAALGAAGKPFTLCLIGDTESLSQAPTTLDSHTIQGRAVRVRHMSHLGLPADCQLLYVARSEQRHLAEILPAAHAGAALTVSLIADFADAGGIIGLSLSEGRLDFDVNAAAARQAGLRLSSQVLKLARSVTGR